DASNDVVYAAVISQNGHLTGVFRSAVQGENWTAMGVPTPEIFPGGQGDIHGAIVADRADPNVVFIAGDTQVGPFPNANGCNTFSGNVFRGVFSDSGSDWQNAVCDGANMTSPHSDARAMAFDANGDIIQGNDGGVYRLHDPNDAANRLWQSPLGNIMVTEAHAATY